MFKERNEDSEGNKKPSKEEVDEVAENERIWNMMADYRPPSYEKDQIYEEELLPLMKQVVDICVKHNIPFAMHALVSFNKEKLSGMWRGSKVGYHDPSLGENTWLPPQLVMGITAVEDDMETAVGVAQAYSMHAAKKAGGILFEKMFQQITDSPAAGESQEKGDGGFTFAPRQ